MDQDIYSGAPQSILPASGDLCHRAFNRLAGALQYRVSSSPKP